MGVRDQLNYSPSHRKWLAIMTISDILFLHLNHLFVENWF